MAVYSDVGVCNLALDRIGIGQTIDDLNGTSHLAQVCARWYAICRDRILESYPWPFTTVRVALELVEEFTESDDPDAEWRFAYRYPNGCMAARRIVSGLPKPQDFDGIPYELGQDGDGRLIFTNQQDAILEMTGTYEDPGEWPGVFADVVSADMASEIGSPLRVEQDRVDRAVGLRNAAWARAAGLASREGRIERPISSYVRARGAVDPRTTWPAR
jgi:hypothetical protein